VLLRQYSRRIDAALRPVLAGCNTPLIVAATEPLASIYRLVNTYPGYVQASIAMSLDRTSDADLAAAARTILDEIYARFVREPEESGTRYERFFRCSAGGDFWRHRAMMVYIDDVVAGTVNEVDGRITFAEKVSAQTYGIVDEIAGRGVALGRERTRRAQGGYPGLRFARRDPAVSRLHPDIVRSAAPASGPASRACPSPSSTPMPTRSRTPSPTQCFIRQCLDCSGLLAGIGSRGHIYRGQRRVNAHD
jgi:hypothetical protein